VVEISRKYPFDRKYIPS